MENKLKRAIELREAGHIEDSMKLLKECLVVDPKNPFVNYQCAWVHDVAGKEREAIVYYEDAIEFGLEGEDLQGAYLGLGSTYRAIGEYLNSERIFQRAMEIFSFNLEFKVFYAMTLYNLKRHGEAMEILLRVIAETSNDGNISEYKNAINFYSDKLDEIW